MGKSPSKKEKVNGFDATYQGSEMYYGWEVRPEFQDFFGPTTFSGHRALDLGAGEGRYAIYLARRGCLVEAVDFSASGLNKLKAIAERHGLTITTRLSDVADFHFEKSAYDLIVAATILDHLETPVREKTLTGISRALKPGGLLYVNVFTTRDPGYGATGPATPGVSDTSFGMAHYFEPGELKDCFADLTSLYYYEGIEEDTSHGRPHHHGWASLIARKE